MSSAARRRGQAVRSTPGSKTDQTMQDLAALRATLVMEANARQEKAVAHRAGMSKSARKRAAKRAAQPVTGNMGAARVEVGSTAPGECPKLNTGSIQVMPPKGKVSRPKGYRLKVMSDYIPGNPGDWTDPSRTSTSAASRAVLKPHWSSSMPDRNAMPSEQAKVQARTHVEQVAYDADRQQGYEAFQTGAQRDMDDAARGVFRDGLGRVIRTSSMEDCEVERVTVTRHYQARGARVPIEVEEFRRVSGRTAREHATQQGLPGIRRLRNVVTEEKWEKLQDKAQRRADKADLRAEKKAVREQAKAERAARVEANSEAREANRAAGKQLRDLARQILAHRGIDKPTPLQLRSMLEFFELNMQRAAARSDLTQAA